MTVKIGSWASRGRLVVVLSGVIALAGCGGNSSSSSSVNTSTTTTTVSNSATVDVNLGPTNNFANGIFTTVKVCAPGSTTNCTSVSDVLVDTGSTGLRLLSSALGSLSLPPIADSSNNTFQECVQFVDLSYIWGPLAQADIYLAGETASSVPIQIISASSPYTVPPNCLTLGLNGAVNDNSVGTLLANGILGVSNFPQDCGSDCTSAENAVPQYYTCPNDNCQIASIPIASQLWNPVARFATDNNGVLLSLPKVPATGAATVSGSLIFGIGTQSNNTLGSAKIYATDQNGDFTTTYNNAPYSQSYIDSGSSILYFMDHATLGISDCGDNPGLYCPAATLSYTVTNTGANGVSGPVTISIANADLLFSNDYAAFNDLGGDSGTDPATDYFDFGLPFFYGRPIFVGIAGTTVPNGANAPYGYWAY
jgi:hypothetical protein